MDDLQTLFEALRDACPRPVWSRAVELARTAVVAGESADDEHVVVSVVPVGALRANTVTFYPGDDDWSCDCDAASDVCEHAAAALIALRQARKAGRALPQPPASTARIRHLFARASGALTYARAFVYGDRTEPFEATLDALRSGRVPGPRFVAGAADLQADLVLGMKTSGWQSPATMVRLVDALAEGADVRLDGAVVRVSRERVGARVVVEDQGDGFRLALRPDASVVETFSNGVALCRDADGLLLRVPEEPRLTARELEELRPGRHVPADARAELFTQVLPSLRARIAVELHTRREPRVVQARARIELQTAREDDALVVLPLLVYGDPAVARVDSGRLVMLGDAMPVRDEVLEERLARRLQSELGLVPGHRERFAGDAGVEFAARLRAWGGEVSGRGAEGFFVAAPIAPRLETRGADFDLRFESEDGSGRARRADAHAVLRAFRAGNTMAPLLEGGFAPLPREWLERHAGLVADLLAAREANRGELPASALPDLGRLCEALEQPAPPALDALRPLLSDFHALPDATLPSDLVATLRPYQKRGADWLAFVRSLRMGALLADDMGLGKTLQALCVVEKPALVVAPTSVLFNWAAEIARFRPSLRTCLYHGPSRTLDPDADVVLASYALLRLDADALAQVRWRTAVLDEAQAIKNPDSQVARAAFRLQVSFRVALTGTPVENRLDELWSVFHFLNPGLLGGRGDFDERYARPVASGDAPAAARLRERIRPFVLRRLKREVAPELPPRSEVVLRCELSPDERALYDAVYAATRDEVVARLGAGGGVMEALEALLRLRQASCHPALLPGRDDETSSKTKLLLEELREAADDGHRSLVFSQWTSLLDLLEPHLRAAGLAFVRLDGATRDRQAVVEAFQRDDGPLVMLLSLKAGGAGLNLTAADHVFLVDPWWNPAVEDQAADRTHRIGQTRPVLVHRLVALGTVEERILSLQEGKRALAEAALSGAQASAALTRDDLLALLA